MESRFYLTALSLTPLALAYLRTGQRSETEYQVKDISYLRDSRQVRQVWQFHRTPPQQSRTNHRHQKAALGQSPGGFSTILDVIGSEKVT